MARLSLERPTFHVFFLIRTTTSILAARRFKPFSMTSNSLGIKRNQSRSVLSALSTQNANLLSHTEGCPDFSPRVVTFIEMVKLRQICNMNQESLRLYLAIQQRPGDDARHNRIILATLQTLPCIRLFHGFNFYVQLR